MAQESITGLTTGIDTEDAALSEEPECISDDEESILNDQSQSTASKSVQPTIFSSIYTKLLKNGR